MKTPVLLSLCLLMVTLKSCKSRSEADDTWARDKRADDVSVQSLQALVQQQAAVIQSLQSSMTAAQNAINTLQAKVSTLENSADSNTKQVVFSVRFHDSTIDVGTHNVLLFDNVVTNVGNGYNAHTGQFTAPVAGVYIFSLTLTAPNDHGELNVVIDKHGAVLALVYAEGTGDRYDQGSTQVSTHLAAGEQVWVCQNQGSTYVRGTWWTVFTGYLLQAD